MSLHNHLFTCSFFSCSFCSHISFVHMFLLCWSFCDDAFSEFIFSYLVLQLFNFNNSSFLYTSVIQVRNTYKTITELTTNVWDRMLSDFVWYPPHDGQRPGCSWQFHRLGCFCVSHLGDDWWNGKFERIRICEFRRTRSCSQGKHYLQLPFDVSCLDTQTDIIVPVFKDIL